MPQDHRPPGGDEVDVLHAVGVGQVRTRRRDTMNRGVPPTARKARTGEFTPPGMTCWARSNNAADAGTSLIRPSVKRASARRSRPRLPGAQTGTAAARVRQDRRMDIAERRSGHRWGVRARPGHRPHARRGRRAGWCCWTCRPRRASNAPASSAACFAAGDVTARRTSPRRWTPRPSSDRYGWWSTAPASPPRAGWSARRARCRWREFAEGRRGQPHRDVQRAPTGRANGWRRRNRSTASAASSSTPRRWRRSTARSGRWPTRRRRVAWSA